MPIINNLTKTYKNEYSTWRESKDLNAAKRQEYLRRNPDAIKDYDLQRAKVLIYATDLMEKSLFLAGKVIEFDPKVRGGQGYLIAKEILTSGRALEALNKIVYAQGKSPQARLGRLTREISATKSGIVESIDNYTINRIGVLAGARQNAGAGLDLLKKVGDKVERGDVLYRVHAATPNDFAFANSAIDSYNGYEISS